MSDDRWRRLQSLFDEATQISREERAAFLDRECADDPELRREVESLIASDEAMGGLVEVAFGRPDPTAGSPNQIGTLEHAIGPYRIVEKIGDGGMGEVWLAEQEQPVRRRVALKLIKPGMDSKQVVARFEIERQALALMDHPCIARAFDAGTSAQGRPYFAMEYVQGEPITKYCDRHRLSTEDRLALFMLVCEGVQHAHHKGVIHRDIKPSNVLIKIRDEEPVPVIIDFGVAKATQQRLTEKSVFTQLGMLIGTPEYMSPEQAELTGLDVDTRTDVYSLGVLLYELLVGALPFDPKQLRQVGFDEIRRSIREDEPSRPSTLISSLGADASREAAETRRTDLSSLLRELRGDLDWITMKAMEKSCARRYQSPAALGEDIQRHLQHEPVTAGPPTSLYRAGKFVRRHRLPVIAAATVALALLIGTALATFGLIRATKAERLARDEAASAEQVAGFLSEMLGSVDPSRLGHSLQQDLRARVADAQREGGQSEVQVEAALDSLESLTRGANMTDAALRLIDDEILDRAVTTIDETLDQDPLIAARLRITIGKTYRNLGFLDKGEEQLRMALEIRRRELEPGHPLIGSAVRAVGWINELQGHHDEAERLVLEALTIARRELGDEHLDTIHAMGVLTAVYTSQGRYDEAERLNFEGLAMSRRVFGDEHPATLNGILRLAWLYECQGRPQDAEALYLEGLDGRKRLLGIDHPETLKAKNDLALVYVVQGRYEEAGQLHREVLAARRRVLGDDHRHTRISMNNLANVLVLRNRFEEAETYYRLALGTIERTLGDEHPFTDRITWNLGVVLARQGELDRAKAYLEKSLSSRIRRFGEDHPDVLFYKAAYAALLGDGDTAIDHLRAAVRKGLGKAEYVTSDVAFSELRGNPEFDSIFAEIRKQRARKDTD